jgi:hypothetical protein
MEHSGGIDDQYASAIATEAQVQTVWLFILHSLQMVGGLGQRLDIGEQAGDEVHASLRIMVCG